MRDWKPLDTKKAIEQRQKQHETTTTANVGAYPVPIGRPMRRAPVSAPMTPTAKKPKK